MIGVLGGLGAAVCWAVATLCASRASREIGALPTLAWIMVLGLVLTAPAVALAGGGGLDGTAIAWLAVSGAGNVGGLLVQYFALRRGKVGVVAPIVSVEGAIAAVLAAIGGEALGVPSAVCLAVIVAGIVLVAAQGRGAEDGPSRSGAVPLSAVGAMLFGVSLYALGQVGEDVAIAWALLPARLLGTVLIAAPLAAGRRLALSGRMAPYVAVAALAEVVGFLSYTVGARDQVGIAAVLGSQFAALAAVGGFLFFGERLRRHQIAGLVVLMLAVGSLAALQA